MDDPRDVATPVCFRHPDRPTRLGCSRCARPICGECSIEASVGQRCPVCVREDGPQQVVAAPRGRVGLRDLAPATYAIIVVTVGAYVLQMVGVIGVAGLGMQPILVWTGEWWRLAGHALLHGGIWHIAFNMYALYALGPGLERALGTVRFVLAYVFAAVAGGVAIHYLGDPRGFAVGASGAIFGLFGLWFGSALAARRTVQGDAQFRSILSLLLINAAISLLPGISWQGHLGGFLAGVVTFLLARADRSGRAAAPLLAVLVVALVVVTQVVPPVPGLGR